MKLIIGLGNPGEKYEKNRHNTGWRAVEFLAGEAGWNREEKFKALTNVVKLAGQKVVLTKPETFMNNSGQAAAKLKNFYKIKNQDILIIYDDIDLLLGTARLRLQGSSGGHHGLDSVLKSLKSEAIARLKIGIAEGRSGKQKIPSEQYVLKNFSKKGEEVLGKVLCLLPDVAAGWVKGDIKDLTSKVDRIV